MKKNLLILCFLLGISAGAFAQGALNFNMPPQVGVNSVTSNPADPDFSATDFFLNDDFGTLTLSVWYAPNSANLLSQAAAINTAAGSAGTVNQAFSLLRAGFTQETFGLSLQSEALTQNLQFGYGNIVPSEQQIYIIGNSSIVSGSLGMYALAATYSANGIDWQGVLVLDRQNAAYSVGGGSGSAAQMLSEWSSQNLLLAPVPEPTTLALAGLGGLSMLFLRRRKA